MKNLLVVSTAHALRVFTSWFTSFTFYEGGSRLWRCHLDKLSIVSSLIPRSSQASDRSNSPLSKSFFYRTHLLWNKLPFNIREIVSPSLFKSETIKYLWSSLLDITSDANSDYDFGWICRILFHPFKFFTFNFISSSLSTFAFPISVNYTWAHSFNQFLTDF